MFRSRTGTDRVAAALTARGIRVSMSCSTDTTGESDVQKYILFISFDGRTLMSVE